jgi:hypothetical protein
MSAAFSCRCRHQSRNSEQIVGGGAQIGMHLHPFATPVAGFAQASYGLHPAEALLNAFTEPLADGVTRMTDSACIKGGAARPCIILRHVRGDIERAAAGDEVAGIIALVAAQRDAAAARQPFIRHGERRPPLGQTIGRLDLKINQQGVAVLDQRVGRIAQFGLLALTLAGQPFVGIGGRLVGRIGATLAMEVHGWIAWVIRSGAIRFVPFALEAFKRGPGLDQGAINREMLIGEPSQRTRLRDYTTEELTGDRVFQQSSAVSGETRMVKARLVQLQVQKPATQQIVGELLAQQPLAANRIQRHQQRGFEQPLRWNRRPPQEAVHLVEDHRQLLEHGIHQLLDAPQRMLLGNPLCHVDHQQHRPLSPFLATHPLLPPLPYTFTTYDEV